MIKRDPQSKFAFATLQSKTGQEILAKAKISGDDLQSVVYFKEEMCLLKSTAILNVLNDLGGGWKLFYLFIFIPPFIRDPVYRMVARTRYRVFGKRDQCMIPSPEIRSRFLN